MSAIEKICGFQGSNPFLDINGRDFSDAAIQEEFCPTSQFWSLFNNQHEILIGTRGSGKTFLLKTMRRSMLTKIDNARAQQLVSEQKYISFYIALQMERMANLESVDKPVEERIPLFRFIFNSCLAISIISEANKYCKELEARSKREAIIVNSDLADRLYKVWFNANADDEVIDLDDLSIQVNKLYYRFDFQNDNVESIPSVFTRDLCAPLTTASRILANFWGADEPTWILAIDEAEFIGALYQKIINSYMRSNPMHIILKIATLPYYWSTLETLDKNSEISVGNDFNYLIVDMDSDKDDFKRLTNKLCSNRLKRIILENNEPFTVDSLEDFLGTVGKDNRVDYFKNETGFSDEKIREGILRNLSPNRKKGVDSCTNLSQTIYKKYAPIYYVREICKREKGRYIPQWFAGSEVVRKVSQGNPRMFINLMSQLFSYATSRKTFGLKDQHKVITNYAHNICESTKAIEKDGETIYKNLSTIAGTLQEKTHADSLLEVGCSFAFKKDFNLSAEESWIKRAISFSRLAVDETAIKSGLTKDTKYVLCNAFAVEYWLTMRSDYPIKISLQLSAKKETELASQLALFSGE